MEKLKQIEKYTTYRERREEHLPEWMRDFLGYMKDLLTWIEGLYSNLTSRINWLLTTTVESHTADDTLIEAETRSIHTNAGASGAVTLTLPSVSYAGIEFTFAVQAAQELRIDPGTAAILDDSGVTVDKYKTANAVGECLKVVSNSDGNWITIAKYGTWIEEV